MKRTNTGFTILEIVLGLLVIGLVSAAFFNSFRTVATISRQSQNTLIQAMKQPSTLPAFDAALTNSTHISAISLTQNPNGFITIHHPQNKRYHIQKINDQIIMSQFNGSTTINTSVIANHVTAFTLTAFAHPTQSINTQTPVPVHLIQTIQYQVTWTTPNYTSRQHVSLARTPHDTPGSYQWGATPTTNRVPFVGHVSTTNISVTPAPVGVTRDRAQLELPSKPVTIAYSGLYFDTIQAAINAASSGNMILISEGEYTETLTLKPGISLVGGYQRHTWHPNPSQYITTLSLTQSLQLSHATQLNHLQLIGNGIPVSIQIPTGNTTLAYCSITNTQQAIAIAGGTHQLINCVVTANAQTIIAQSADLTIYRSRFASLSTATTNIHINPQTHLSLRNSLVMGGSAGIQVTQGSATIANALIRGTQDAGIRATQNASSSIQIMNSIIESNAGVGIQAPSASIQIDYNFLGANTGGNYAPDPGQGDQGNIETGLAGYANTTTFELIATSPLVDAGHPSANQTDAFFNSNPSHGTSANDIGLYGGPHAGRLGTYVRSITPSLQLWNQLQIAYPAEIIIVNSGIHTSSQALILKPNSTLIGQSAHQSVIQLTSPAQIQIANQPNSTTHIQSLTIMGNASTTGIAMINTGRVTIQGLVLTQLGTAISNQNSTARISHITADSVDYGLISAGKQSTISQSLFSHNNQVAITQTSGTVTATDVLLHANTTHTSGTINQINVSDQPIQFVNQPNRLFFLTANSPAINAASHDTHTDYGPFPYHHRIGTLTTAPLTSPINRQFTSVTIHYSDGHTHNQPIGGDIKVITIIDGVSTTLSPTIPVIQASPQQTTIPLALTAFGQSIQVKAQLQTTTTDISPILNTLQIDWQSP